MTSAPVQPAPQSDILPVTIEEEMQRSYLDYAMSVIVSRALPDVRDGLKPVHRRIIFTMKEKGYDYNRPYRKSARIVGDVMGVYHPHGDAAIYDALVRMVQTFSMRLPLIDGQGNFGSMDGDPPAAMRYTEARLARSAHSLIEDIDQKTVNFQPNYDGTAEEPIVLPARYPNLLVNGAEGIAVGMATKIAPHNLGEVIDACIAYIENPAITVDEMIERFVPGPDFPTAGIIMGRAGIVQALRTGRGTAIMRGRVEIEEIRKDREAIVITEIPYQVNKARMIEIIAEHVRDKKIEGISDLRDESDRRGLRVVVEIKREADASVVLNQLYAYSPLQTSFGINMLALNGGRPLTMNLREVIAAFIEFREEVVRRRTIFELEKARERAHILVGLAVAVANLDDVIKLIRAAPDATQARAQLLARAWPAADVAPLVALIDEPGRKIEDGKYRLSDAQARAILDMRLQRLTGLERDKIADDLKVLGKEIEGHLAILSSRQRLFEVMKGELLEVKAEFATPRRTEISDQEIVTDIEDIIQREDMIVTVTNTGYIKRVPVSAYRAQRRGGRGRAGMSVREEDFVNRVFVANTHTSVLFFSSAGKVYKLKVYELPLGTPQARGKALVNLLPLKEGEAISTVMPLPEDEPGIGSRFVMFATASGNVRRNQLSDFVHVMSNGKIAMKLDPGDSLVDVHPCTEDDDILLAAHSGKCIRFPVPDVRVFSGRSSDGVRGIRLGDKDRVISMSILRHAKAESEKREEYLQAIAASRRLKGGDYQNRAEDQERDKTLAARLKEPEFEAMAAAEDFILSVTENGYGKRSSAYEYRITGRGGQGIANIETSARNGPVVASFPVGDGDHLVMVSDSGQIIRCPVRDIRIAGRKTQGVTLFTLSDGEKLVSVTRLAEVSEADEAAASGNGSGNGHGNGGAADIEAEAGDVEPEAGSEPEDGTEETPS